MNAPNWSVDVAWWLAGVIAALALAGVAAWCFRRVTHRRLRLPGYFLVAVAVHVFLVFGSFYVYLDPGVVPQIQRQFHRIVVSSRTSLESVRRLFKPSVEPFEQVADLKSIQTEDPSAGASTPPAPSPAPPSDVPLTLEPLPRRSLAPPPRGYLVAPPEDTIAMLDPRQIPRRRAAIDLAGEPIEIEAPRAAEKPAEKPLEGVSVGLGLRGTTAEPAVASAILPGPVSVSTVPSAKPSQPGVAGELDPEAFAPLTLVQIPRRERAMRPAGLPEADARAEAISLPSTPSPSGGAGQGGSPGLAIPVDVPRREAPTAVGPGLAPGWPRLQPDLPAGNLARGAVQGPLADSSLAQIDIPDGSLMGRLPRRATRLPSLSYDGEKIGLQAMFSHRQGEKKREAIEAFGGSPLTVAAVRLGLAWLEKGQHKDGYWSLERIYTQDRGQEYPGRGGQHSDSAATGLGLLPFLADGHTHLTGEHQATVRKGIGWLVKHQKADGDLSFQTDGNAQMYAHAIAAIALCEAFGMSRDPDLQSPAQRAIDFIIKAQTKELGGWRYHPNQDCDTSVVGWVVMALKSGQMAGLSVPRASLELVHKWLDKIEGKGKEVGTFRYQPGYAITPEMTAEGLLCAQYLGADRNSPRLQAGAAYLLKNLPKKGQRTSYYWYYGTQVMYHMQGDYWPKWNAALRDQLVQTQHKDGPLSGTWDPGDEWEWRGGRLYGTSLRLLMLSVYYRHLPLYQVLER